MSQYTPTSTTSLINNPGSTPAYNTSSPTTPTPGQQAALDNLDDLLATPTPVTAPATTPPNTLAHPLLNLVPRSRRVENADIILLAAEEIQFDCIPCRVHNKTFGVEHVAHSFSTCTRIQGYVRLGRAIELKNSPICSRCFSPSSVCRVPLVRLANSVLQFRPNNLRAGDRQGIYEIGEADGVCRYSTLCYQVGIAAWQRAPAGSLRAYEHGLHQQDVFSHVRTAFLDDGNEATYAWALGMTVLRRMFSALLAVPTPPSDPAAPQDRSRSLHRTADAGQQ